MRAAAVVEREVVRQLLPRLLDVLVGMEVYVFVLHAPPQTIDEHVVHPSTLAVHACLDVVTVEHVGKRLAGELTSLVGIEDSRCAILGNRLFERLDTEIASHTDREPMR